MRLGVFLPNWVGDVVMATPALRTMRNALGEDGMLIGIMRPYVAEVLAGTNWFDQRILYEKPSRRWKAASHDVYRLLREAKLDRIILLTNSLRTAWIAWRSGARERIGYRGQARAWLVSTAITPLRAEDGGLLPTIEGYLHLAQAAGYKPSSPRLELATTPADEQAADDVWRRLGLPAGERVVVLNSGAAYGSAKQWPSEYFAELARRIVANDTYWVLVNCGPAERDIAGEIASKAKHSRVVSLAGVPQLPVGLTKACMRRSRMLVTTDSGPRYFGIAFGRPVVTLFGPTDPRRTETHYPAESCVSLSLECQPCMERTCPLVHHRCMRELSVEMVYEAVSKALARGRLDTAHQTLAHN
ncbi:MAG TPA: lipopolysaccharide heptosyltransferase II [Lacipirellulaceae bacterium]|nr:lipopolysaccharide heptosyltransferase II [Lacipirellulaceae bacterium]